MCDPSREVLGRSCQRYYNCPAAVAAAAARQQQQQHWQATVLLPPKVAAWAPPCQRACQHRVSSIGMGCRRGRINDTHTDTKTHKTPHPVPYRKRNALLVVGGVGASSTPAHTLRAHDATHAPQERGATPPGHACVHGPLLYSYTCNHALASGLAAAAERRRWGAPLPCARAPMGKGDGATIHSQHWQ